MWVYIVPRVKFFRSDNNRNYMGRSFRQEWRLE